jgi:hypothetical protein
MASITYKNVLPLNVQDYYSPGSQLDWNVKIGDNARALRSSFKLSGQFVPYKVGLANADNNLDGTLDVRMDASVGMHSVCSMFITSVNGSQKEAISYYPRLIAHRSVAEDSTDAMMAEHKSAGEASNDDFPPEVVALLTQGIESAMAAAVPDGEEGAQWVFFEGGN